MQVNGGSGIKFAVQKKIEFTVGLEIYILNDSKTYFAFKTKTTSDNEILCMNYICITLLVSSKKDHLNNGSCFQATQITKKKISK